MANELCMRCFNVKGKYSVCPFCGYEDGTPPDKPHYLMPGTILAGHFIAGVAIGASESRIAYKCYDTTLGVIVTVKEFYPENLVRRKTGDTSVELFATGKEKEYRTQTERFLLEAQSIAPLGKVKDIVNVYDYFEENNTAYTITEYVDDDLLLKRMKEGKMEPGVASAIMGRIIEAVKKIHVQGIIHRNLTPVNIYISLDNEIKISNFSSAYLNDSVQGASGNIVIEQGYSAPEQYHGNKTLGYFTDIYSLGAIYYQMLTGQKPDDASKREVKDNLKSPIKCGAAIDENTDKAIMEALAVQPELRFQGIQQFDDALNGKRIAEYPKDKLRKTRRKRFWAASYIGMALVAAVVGIMFFDRYYNKENIMFDTKITKADTVTIWVDSADCKEALESVKSGVSEINPGDSEAVQQMKKENGNIEYIIEDITSGGYGSMDSALQAALDGKEQFPDIFVSDNVPDLEKYDLVSYKDNVYKNINTDDYLYFSAYEQYFPDMKEMPVSFDVLLFYAIDTENSAVTSEMKKQFKKYKIKQGSLVSASSDGTIELKDIIEANNSGTEYTYLDENTAALATALYNRGSFNNYNGTFNFDEDFISVFSDFLKMQDKAVKNAKWKNSSSKNAAIMYGTSVLSGSGYRSRWFTAKLGNNSIPYNVMVPVVDGKMLVQYKMKLAISASTSKSRRIAAERFVYFALGQQQCAVDKNTAYPVFDAMLLETKETASTFDEFFEINTSQSIVQTLVKEKHYPCMVVAKGSGDIAKFAAGIKENGLRNKAEIESYCNTFKED